MSTCISQEPHVQTSQNILYVLTVTVDQSSSDDNAIRYALLVLWMTSCLPISHAKAMPTGHILKEAHQEAALGANSDVYDCLLLNESIT